MRVLAAAAAALGAAAGAAAVATPFPEDVFGTWAPKPGVGLQAILGPLSYSFFDGFSALRDPDTGDAWFTLLSGQTFRVNGSEMQYCFGNKLLPGQLVEQSPFSVDSMGDTNVTFCWRTGLKGMPTHHRGCSGCDCAKITIVLTAADELDFTFWMSPPVVHAKISLVRTGAAPGMSKITATMAQPYEKCQMVPHYGPDGPYGPGPAEQPDLRNNTPWPEASGYEAALTLGAGARKALAALPRGCALGVLNRMKQNSELARLVAAESGDSTKKCAQLNGLNLQLNKVAFGAHKRSIPDVRLQFIEPTLPCDPCDVSYSVSAAIDEDEYIALGFKGQSWERMDPYPPQYARPCYFGMCVDGYDNFTTDRIALGYASSSVGSCVREVALKDNLIGKPSDVEAPLLKDTSVERSGKRTIVRFTVSQHWPTYAPGGEITDGPFRTMWAIGKVTGGDSCEADFGYHGISKGVSPINWLEVLGSTPCTFSDSEMGL